MRAQSVTSTLAYTYTATGLRVAQSVGGEETEFAWDWASGLPEMLSEGGNLYLVGHETLGQWDGDEWAYYLPDGLGSVRQVTDETGAVVSAREWTPYGVEVGSAQAGLGYTGEWQDAALGLTYLRARWYDGQVGRFTQRDPIEGVLNRNGGYNAYTYADQNPLRYIDPTGLDGIEAGYLEYSCRCGWIDFTHASPQAAWEIIQKVRVDVSDYIESLGIFYDEFGLPPYTRVDFDLGNVGRVLPTYRYYWGVREGLTDQRDLEVALAIFQEASRQYEAWQGTWGEITPGPIGETLRTSVLHEEDLPSNGIGFYIASWMEQKGLKLEDLLGNDALWEQYKNQVRRLCETVGYVEGDSTTENEVRIKRASKEIAEHYPWEKQYHFEGRTNAPLPCNYCSTSCRRWPGELSSIVPAPVGTDWWMLGAGWGYQLLEGGDWVSYKIADGVYAYWPGDVVSEYLEHH